MNKKPQERATIPDESIPATVLEYMPVRLLVAIAEKFGPRRVPAIGNSLMLLTIVLVVASAVALIANVRYAVFGTLIAVFILPTVQLLGSQSRAKSSIEQKIFQWASLIAGIASLFLIISSVFFDTPVPLKGVAFTDIKPELIVELPSEYRKLELTAQTVKDPPKWLYPETAAKNTSGDLRRKMGNWIVWSADGIQGGKLMEASWITGFTGRHHFTATLSLTEADQKHISITDGIVFVIDDRRAGQNQIEMRQFPLQINAESNGIPTCEFKDVKQGEKLLFLLNVTPTATSSRPLPESFIITINVS